MFKIIAAILPMLDAIRRFLDDLRPADWAILTVELAFLAVVGLQWALDVIHKHKMRKRHGELFDMRQRGNELLRAAPSNIASTPEDHRRISDWEGSTKTWIRQTADTLKQCSPKAAREFFPEDNPDYFAHSSNPDHWKGSLETRLQHLDTIMNNTDMYF